MCLELIDEELANSVIIDFLPFLTAPKILDSIALLLAYASRQPFPPHEHALPFKSTIICPISPAEPLAP